MLYCPKCQQTYDEGTRRFCPDDNARLLPAPSSGKSAHQTGGVFTNAFSRAAQRKSVETGEKTSLNFAAGETFQTGFRPPPTSKIFKVEPEAERTPENKPQVEISQPIQKPQTPPQQPLPRIIKQNEILPSQAKLGDRKTNPTGRLALTWNNPEVLVGQSIKGRYQVNRKIVEDETGIEYQAEDKIVGNKKVSVRILMDEDADDYFTNKIFAEERVSLSHVNHPNIAGVVDSGELPEGKPFIITEFVEGKSVADMLRQTGQFNALRAARIIRQASYALSDVHQSGILHRGLKPANIVLPVSEDGVEQVKLTNFGVSRGKFNKETLVYKSPEQIEGKTPTIASDVYSLAIVAYQMLTNRLPFNASTANGLLKAQREGLTLVPTNLRLDITPLVDEILVKALAFNPSDRYPKARDFGDALFNAVTTSSLWEDDSADAENIDINAVGSNNAEQTTELLGAPLALELTNAATVEAPASLPAVKTSADLFEGVERRKKTDQKKSASNFTWERRSTDKPKSMGSNWALAVLLGALIIVSVSGLAYFLMYRPDETAFLPTPPQVNPAENVAPNSPAPTVEIESPPLARRIQPPPNTVYFENSKQNLKTETAKNFLGFSLYYPKDWRQNDAKGNFLDVSKNAPSGTPIEQILVSYYDSKGTFNNDKPLFPNLVKQTNTTLKTIVPNYKQISEGEKTVNNGWRAYEVKFEGAGKTAKGEDIKLWGRRLFIPAARNGLKNGYVLTLLATSLSPDVKSVDDVGTKDDLSTVLNTFEPNQNF